MNKQLSKEVVSLFESLKRTDERNYEYWSARDLWKVLEYTEYRHFLPVIEKAKRACENVGQVVTDHFEDFLEMVAIGMWHWFVPPRKVDKRKMVDKLNKWRYDNKDKQLDVKQRRAGYSCCTAGD